jgi:glycerol-3-phosphate dehydrogenase (NAD(P)+)
VGDFQHIGIVGAGAWGVALANAVARAGRQVTLYSRSAAAVHELAVHRTLAARLPGILIDAGIEVTTAIRNAAAADALLLVVPAQNLRSLAVELTPHVRAGLPAIACAKGIERDTGRFVTEIIEEVMPQAEAAILSGPSFAVDVARGLPTAVTLAAEDDSLAASLAEALSSPTLRLYHCTDRRGVEIGGAAKNVLAIAAGIVAGRALGASAEAALIARGFAELTRLGKALGARPETLSGLSGLGDLVLTCSSPQSRNYAAGLALSRGEDPATHLTEGVFTAPVLADLARRKNVQMPICEAVAAVLDRALPVDEAIRLLLSRPLRAES